MKHSIIYPAVLAALAALTLSACDRPAVVTTPAVITVPGPAGPTGATGATGDTGSAGAQGQRGSTGGDTVVIMPAAPASR
jgi:hypothetical protein